MQLFFEVCHGLDHRTFGHLGEFEPDPLDLLYSCIERNRDERFVLEVQTVLLPDTFFSLSSQPVEMFVK